MPGFSQPGDDRVPEVRLGALAEGGLAPAIMAIVERGVARRPEQARALRIEVELRMDESYPPVRIVFGEDLVLVEDGPAVDSGPADQRRPLRSGGVAGGAARSAVCRTRSTPAVALRSGCSRPGASGSRVAWGSCAAFWG